MPKKWTLFVRTRIICTTKLAFYRNDRWSKSETIDTELVESTDEDEEDDAYDDEEKEKTNDDEDDVKVFNTMTHPDCFTPSSRPTTLC